MNITLELIIRMLVDWTSVGYTLTKGDFKATYSFNTNLGVKSYLVNGEVRNDVPEQLILDMILNRMRSALENEAADCWVSEIWGIKSNLEDYEFFAKRTTQAGPWLLFFGDEFAKNISFNDIDELPWEKRTSWYFSNGEDRALEIAKYFRIIRLDQFPDSQDVLLVSLKDPRKVTRFYGTNAEQDCLNYLGLSRKGLNGFWGKQAELKLFENYDNYKK